jgi:hypothetical protein
MTQNQDNLDPLPTSLDDILGNYDPDFDGEPHEFNIVQLNHWADGLTSLNVGNDDAFGGAYIGRDDARVLAAALLEWADSPESPEELQMYAEVEAEIAAEEAAGTCL